MYSAIAYTATKQSCQINKQCLYLCAYDSTKVEKKHLLALFHSVQSNTYSLELNTTKNR